MTRNATEEKGTTGKTAILRWIRSRDGLLMTTRIDGCIGYSIAFDRGMTYGRASSERDLRKKIGIRVLRASGHEDPESLEKEVEMWEESLGKGSSGNA